MTLQLELLKVAERHPTAAAMWLVVYRSLFRNTLVSLAMHLEKSIGKEAGVEQLAAMLEDGVKGVLLELKSLVESMGARLETVDDLLAVNQRCHEEGRKIAQLGLEIFTVRRDGQRYYMETSDCVSLRLAEEKGIHILRVAPLAITAGFIKALGYRVKWLTTGRRLHQLCHSVRAGVSEPYDYVVYYDESVKPPACRIIVERLDCSRY